MINYDQFGQKDLIVKGITIHNTGNSKSAKELYKWMKTTSLNTGCHYLVDDNEIIQVLPLDYMAYHTGKGLDYGNKYTIAIEICKSQSNLETYLKAQNRAILLIKKLMLEYELTINDIYFHNSFDLNKYCPHRVLDIYKNRKNFIRKELMNV